MANSEELLAQNDVAAYVYVAVRDAVAALAGADNAVACAFGVAPDEASGLPCVTVIPQNANPVEKKYLDGSRVSNCAFALLLRTQATAEEDLLGACALLEKVAKRLEEGFSIGEGRQLWSVAVDGLPHFVEEAQVGDVAATAYSDWRVTLSVTYRSLA